MLKIYIVGKVRGFFRHLVEAEIEDMMFIGKNDTFEVSSKLKGYLSRLIKTPAIGFLGFLKINSANGHEVDYYISYNRFLKSDKPYVIYLENPTALCNYSLTCLQSPFIKRRLKKQLQNRYLKKIVCMSKCCETTISKILDFDIPSEKLAQIYPYVPSNKYVSNEIIKKRCSVGLKLLFIAQGSRFFSKGGAEILKAFLEVQKNYNISLTVITNLEYLDESILSLKDKGISFFDFKFTYFELERIYVDHSVLLQPSSDDSFGLTVLEALKAGLPIIASNMYAFKEMVEEDVNGYLVEPSYYFFDQNDIPNPKVWNHRNKTIYSKQINHRLVNDLCNRIERLNTDRGKLLEMSLNSLKKAETVFGKDKIVRDWQDTLK